MRKPFLKLASSALALTALTVGSSAHAQTVQQQLDDLKARVASLQQQLVAVQANHALALGPFVSVDPNPQIGVAGPNITFTGANLHLVSGSGATNDGGTTRGLGNLIIGYDEDPTQPGSPLNPGDRGGSHNLVIGARHRFTQTAFGSLLAGENNTVSARASSVGGVRNQARGLFASVSGGADNIAWGVQDSISGGTRNQAIGTSASVSGGADNIAWGVQDSISGGVRNQATGASASVSGGADNIASGQSASVIGGRSNTASGENAIAPHPPFP